MDSKENHEQTKSNDSMPLGVETNDVKDNTSRFSRRRFLRSAAVSSPILLAVKSPSAWGALYAEQCSISIYLSGNPSSPEPLNCDPKDTAYWIRTLSGGNKIVEDEVYRLGYTGSTSFYDIFPMTMFSGWVTRDTTNGNGNRWYFRFDPTSDNPTLLQALQGSGFRLFVEFDRNLNNSSIDYRMNIVNGVPEFHSILVTAFLNSLFHPTPVSYFYTDIVKARLAEALENAVDQVVADIHAGVFLGADSVAYSQAMQTLSGDISTWNV